MTTCLSSARHKTKQFEWSSVLSDLERCQVGTLLLTSRDDYGPRTRMTAKGIDKSQEEFVKGCICGLLQRKSSTYTINNNVSIL